MRRKAFTWWQAVLILVGLAIIAAVFFPIFGRPRESKHPSSCLSNLKQIGLGIKQYVQDYDEKYPLVNSGKEGWMDIIQPYIKSVQLFQCLSDKTGSVTGTNDFFYNARLAGQKEDKLIYISNTIMNGDGVGDSPTNASLSQFPAEWATDYNSPAWRHLDGANYGYADGHVKWLKPTSMTNKKAAPNISTFALW